MQPARIVSDQNEWENRRSERRRRVLKEARIILNGRFSVIDCMARDLSGKGCRLRLHHAIDLPRGFLVAFPSVGVERPAMLVWQKGRDVGVKFLDAEPPAAFTRLLPD
jgi:two-component system cell cycle response regulator